ARAALAGAKGHGGNRIEFVAVQAATLTPVPDAEDSESNADRLPAARPATATARRAAPASRAAIGARGMAFGGLAAIGLVIWAVGSIATLDWAMLGVMATLSALAGFTFYFKTLPVALTLAGELHRATSGRWAARLWRLWPQYLAFGTIGVMVICAFN